MTTDMTSLSRSLRCGSLHAVDLIETTLARIDALDGKLGAFAAINRESALAAAHRVDAELAAGQWRGPLHGIPFGAKDLLASADLPTEVGMAIFKEG